MPQPNDYTRATLTVKLMAILEDTATVIGWVDTTYPDGDYDSIVEAVESQLVVADVAEATDKLLVELHSAVEVWRSVAAQEVTAYDIGGLKEITNRSQIFSHAMAMLAKAQADLDVYLAKGIQAELGIPNGIAYSTVLKVRAVW